MKKIKIFLASSKELKRDREKFEIEINRKDKLWRDKNILLQLDIWEDLSGRMSSTRSQDEYNLKIRECDLFVLLAHSKIGMYTEEEFETAFGAFKKNKKPFIFLYFKDIKFGQEDSLKLFKKKLNDLGHFYATYLNFDQLWNLFNKELDRLILIDFQVNEKKNNNFYENELASFSLSRKQKMFQAGGALGVYSVYVERKTDQIIKDRLKRKKHGLITIGGPRTIGKTSLIRNISKFAEKIGFEKILNLDLSAYGLSDASNFWKNIYFDFEKNGLIDYQKEKSQKISPVILQTKLLQIKKSTLITVDETDVLPNELSESLMNFIYNVTKMQLRGYGGGVTFLISYVPFNKSIKSNIIRDFEIGFHTKLHPFNLNETKDLFLEGNLDLSIQEINGIFKYTGGFPFPCQYFALGLQRKVPESEIIESFLPEYSYFILGGLTEDEKTFVESVLKQKKINNRFAGSLFDRQIFKQVDGTIEFTSLIIEKIMKQNFGIRKENKKWWRL